MMSIEQSRKLDKRNAMDTHQAALLNVSQLLNLLGYRSIGGARAACRIAANSSTEVYG